MILGRLFTRLFERGVVVVATSNVEPDELYKDGLNRALFVPFIELLREQMEVVRLEAPKDFRLEKLAGAAGLVRAGRRGRRRRARRWLAAPHRHARGRAARDRRQGARHPRAGSRAWASRAFPSRSSASSRSARADYLRIAHEFHTVILDGIPVMDYRRSATRRSASSR